MKKEQKLEPQPNSASTADSSQVSPLAQNRLLSAALSVEEILSGNRLIAEFMCWDRTEPPNSTLFEQSIKHTQFHRSWDWLMPVVTKIEGLGFTFIIDGLSAYCYEKGKIMEGKSGIAETKIEAVWIAVIKFIKWYNDNAGVCR